MKHFDIHIFFLCYYILFTGCTKDTLSIIKEDNTKVYLKIYIPHTDIKSRTIGAPTIPGTPDENIISDVTIYLTNGGRVIKIDNIDMSNTSDSFVSSLIPIEADIHNQEFQVFLVANPEKAKLTLRSTDDFKELYSPLNQIEANNLVTPGQMVMSNQVEQSPIPTIIVTKENTKENPAKVHILLDRLAVKIEPQISIDFTADFTNRPNENAFFENFNFTIEATGLLNAATEFNLEQRWSKKNNEESIQLLSPTWYYSPEEQYFNKYYNTINDYADTNTAPFFPINEYAEDGYRLISSPFYCLENNPPFYDYTGSVISPENQIKTKYKGLTTGIVIKAQAIKDNNAATFYRHEGIYYSDTETDRQKLAETANLSPIDFENISLLRERNIKVYKDGYIYYTYWIKDINSAYSGEDYDLSYAIIRNSYYKLKINKLLKIGDDIPGGGYKPEEPIDKIEQIEIVAICQDWTFYNVTHEFN